MSDSMWVIVIVMFVVLLANIAVFGLTLKLYTEMFKELAQQRRAKS